MRVLRLVFLRLHSHVSNSGVLQGFRCRIAKSLERKKFDAPQNTQFLLEAAVQRIKAQLLLPLGARFWSIWILKVFCLLINFERSQGIEEKIFCVVADFGHFENKSVPAFELVRCFCSWKINLISTKTSQNCSTINTWTISILPSNVLNLSEMRYFSNGGHFGAAAQIIFQSENIWILIWWKTLQNLYFPIEVWQFGLEWDIFPLRSDACYENKSATCAAITAERSRARNASDLQSIHRGRTRTGAEPGFQIQNGGSMGNFRLRPREYVRSMDGSIRAYLLQGRTWGMGFGMRKRSWMGPWFWNLVFARSWEWDPGIDRGFEVWISWTLQGAGACQGYGWGQTLVCFVLGFLFFFLHQSTDAAVDPQWRWGPSPKPAWSWPEAVCDWLVHSLNIMWIGCWPGSPARWDVPARSGVRPPFYGKPLMGPGTDTRNAYTQSWMRISEGKSHHQAVPGLWNSSGEMNCTCSENMWSEVVEAWSSGFRSNDKKIWGPDLIIRDERCISFRASQSHGFSTRVTHNTQRMLHKRHSRHVTTNVTCLSRESSDVACSSSKLLLFKWLRCHHLRAQRRKVSLIQREPACSIRPSKQHYRLQWNNSRFFHFCWFSSEIRTLIWKAISEVGSHRMRPALRHKHCITRTTSQAGRIRCAIQQEQKDGTQGLGPMPPPPKK